MFMPAFPWHQMGGEFGHMHRLVSTLSYILYTCLFQEFLKWFIFSLNFLVCMCYLQLCVPMHVNNFKSWAAVFSSLLKPQHHVEFWISKHGNSLFFPPTTLKRAPTCKSTNGLLPQWTASSFPWRTVSSTYGLPPLSMNGPCLSQWMASPLSEWPPSLNGQPPPSLNGWPPPSLWPIIQGMDKSSWVSWGSWQCYELWITLLSCQYQSPIQANINMLNRLTQTCWPQISILILTIDLMPALA